MTSDDRQGSVALVLLLILDAVVAITALAGGAALVIGALDPELATVLTPPLSYLESSPFSSYLVPGLALTVIVGGIHSVAFVAVLQRRPRAVLAATAAAFGMLIWIFVQMVYIPFSILQAVYVAAGLAELGLVLLILGVLRPDPRSRPGR